MGKAARHLSAVLGRVLFIGLSAQAVLGLLWMLCNFTSFQEYGTSLFLELVSGSLVCDDYTGILYPLLIRAARGIASAVPVPYYCLLYLLQLGVGYAADFFFLRTILDRNTEKKERGKKERLLTAWGALILVTIPAAAQCHLAVLPCSLTGSLLLLQLGVLLQKDKQTSKKWTAAGAARETAAGQTAGAASGARPARTEALLGALWLLETLLMPEYLWIGVVPVLVYGIAEIVKSGRGELSKRLGIALVAAAFLGLAPLSLELTTQPGAYGRMENTFEGMLLRRVCGGYLQEYYGNWPREMRERILQEELVECMSGSEGMDFVMGREIESALEDQTVKRLYREMVRQGWENNGSVLVREIAMDVLGYGFAPVSCRIYPRMAYYDSYARGNYDVMRRRTPRLTYEALSYGEYCFVLGLGLTAILELTARLCAAGTAPQKKDRKRGISVGLVCGAMGLWICLWYAMQGQGRMDHKYSYAVTVLWFAWMSYGAVREIGQTE